MVRREVRRKNGRGMRRREREVKKERGSYRGERGRGRRIEIQGGVKCRIEPCGPRQQRG